MTSTLLSVRDLRVSYKEISVAHVPELDVKPGQCVALVGESGSGKTSTLLAVLGLAQQQGAIVTGKVMLCGCSVLDANVEALRAIRGNKVALISQSPISALNPTMRLGKFAMLAIMQHGATKGEAHEKLHRAFASVALSDQLLDRYPHQVSGGQAQRFSIALALALGAEIIVADEPTSALDVTVQAEIMKLLKVLQRDAGLGLLIVSHDLALISGIADHIVVMKDGKVVESGPIFDVINHPSSEYTRALISAIPEIHGV